MAIKTWADGDVLYATDINNSFLAVCPIGTILPWAKSITGVPALPANWIECTGATISDAASPMNGQTVPNLNGGNNFLRGNSTSGGTGTLAATGSADIPYYNVVFIIRIK
jgi:hypothetical protein